MNGATKTIRLLFLFLLIAVGYGIYSYTRKVKSAGNYKPVATFSIDSLTKHFAANPESFETTYREKVIRIRGNAEKVEQQSASVVTILFPETNGYVVHCEVQKSAILPQNTLCLDCFYVGHEKGMEEMGIPSLLRFNRCEVCNE